LKGFFEEGVGEGLPLKEIIEWLKIESKAMIQKV